MINLGDHVKDCITGLEGIAVGYYKHMNGCEQFVVQPQALKDGVPVESKYIDSGQLEVLNAGAFAMNVKPTGAPAVRMQVPMSVPRPVRS